jgi:hypothetical protein
VIQALSAVRPGRTASSEEVRGGLREQLLEERRAAELTRWAGETQAAYASRIVYAPGFAP